MIVVEILGSHPRKFCQPVEIEPVKYFLRVKAIEIKFATITMSIKHGKLTDGVKVP